MRNPDVEITKEISTIKDLLGSILNRHERELTRRVRTKRLRPDFIEEVIHILPFKDKTLGIQIILSLFREDFPWIYDAGLETVRIFRASENLIDKDMALDSFMRLIDFSFDHPIMRDYLRADKNQYMLLKELGFLFKKLMMQNK